jgi:hypothetical protein
MKRQAPGQDDNDVLTRIEYKYFIIYLAKKSKDEERVDSGSIIQGKPSI